MADSNGMIEALEHRLMRAWLGGERKAVAQMLSSRFRLVAGSATPVLLDRKSMVDAIGDRWTIGAFRFGPVYTRMTDGVGIFAAEIELESRIDGVDASGRWWMTDLWTKSKIRRRWQLVDRQVARPESGHAIPAALKGLQLWR
ncbi:hypothetical protein GCM10022280_13230 [Sphingomonas swuensis]|uniref:DUF4440 domain-containing protein n=1 Tax=Sphingomonas swuensis TaxID=977800 RepID=A0ABP7SS36_9SPHN